MIKKFPLLLLLALGFFSSNLLFGAHQGRYLKGYPPSPLWLDDSSEYREKKGGRASAMSTSSHGDSDDEEPDTEMPQLPSFKKDEAPEIDELARASARLTVSSSSAEYGERGSSSLSNGRRSAGSHSLFSPKNPTAKPPSALCISPRLGIIRPSSFKRQSSISETPMETAEDGAAAAAADARPETPIPSFSQEPPKGIYSPRKNKRARSASPNETRQEAGSPTKRRRGLSGVLNAQSSNQPVVGPDENLMDTGADSSSDDDDL